MNTTAEEKTPEEEAVAPEAETQEAELQPEEPAVEIPLEEDELILPDDNAKTYEELESEAAELKEKWVRAVAEAENLRRRGEREKQDALKYGVTNFARDMVAVADNLRRALDSAPKEDAAELPEAVKNMLMGVEMTEKELQAAFQRQGIKKVEALGKRFDHNFHQAMYEIDDASQPSGMVAQVMADGYVIHDRLLRPAMVGVTKGGPKPEDTAPASDAKEDPKGDGTAYESQGEAKGGNFDAEL